MSLSFVKSVANGFIFLTHNISKCLQLVFLAPVGDYMGKVRCVFFF